MLRIIAQKEGAEPFLHIQEVLWTIYRVLQEVEILFGIQ